MKFDYKIFDIKYLGLYLCKKIIDLLYGEISVRNQFGKGSEFKFIIPIEFKEGGLI
ncbi:MAG: hypothetical protein ACTSWY_03100 [Promethearchaeota archaeon]